MRRRNSLVPDALDWKQRAIEQWTADPCGPPADDIDGLLRARRAYAPFMADVLDYDGARGMSVLDVGCGQGIDLCEYARAGATVTGIDLTPRHVELARLHLDALGLEGTVIEGDAENMPFDDETFDRASSNGVLHHTPDFPRALEEIRRVIRPGGRATIIVYNRDSGYYWIEQVLRYGILQGQLLRERTMGNVLSRNVEISSIAARPLVRVYTRKALHRMLETAGFRDVSVAVSPFESGDTFITRYWPGRVRARLSSFPLGWYLIARGHRT
jgi:ubiquinone/menaquinone biosynthesis C-methylase UbiE